MFFSRYCSVQASASKPTAPPAPLRKRYTNDPGPVRLPNGEFVEDKKSPTGRLMTSGVDLKRMTADARAVGGKYQKSAPLGGKLAGYDLRLALLEYVAQGGTYDEQREGSQLLGGFTQYRQYVHVSNFNVGLFCQQAGLSLHDTLKIAGTYAKTFGSNADPNDFYGLGAEAREFTLKGWFAGDSDGFPAPPGSIELDDQFYNDLSVDMGRFRFFRRQLK